MKRIPLTQGKFAIVDDEDYVELSKYKWCAMKNWNTFYAVRMVPVRGRQKTVLMHREILHLIGSSQGDHRNRNGLDNTRNNLRECSPSENSRNQVVKKNNISGYKGVHWDKVAKKWVACVGVNSKQIYLGTFTCLIKAAKCYNEAAEKYHGEFARLNII